MDELTVLKQKYVALQRAYLMQQRQLNALLMVDVERQEAELAKADTGNGEPPAQQHVAMVAGDTGNGEPPPN